MDAPPESTDPPASLVLSVEQMLHLWYDDGEDFAVIFLGVDAIVLGANAAIEKVLGYQPPDLIGHTLQRIFTPEDLERGLDRHELSLAVRVGRAEDDRWHVGKDGRRVWISGVLMALRDASGVHVGFAKLMRNRTDLRAEIESLTSRLDSAAATIARQEEALMTLGHEIRNPLNTLGNAFSILQKGSSLTDKLSAVISRQLSTLLRLMGDLRESSRARQDGNGTLQLETFSLQAAIAAAVTNHEATARARCQLLQMVLPEPPIVIQADPVRLEQILGNLLQNAIKYTPEGGHVTVSATVEGETAVLRVVDDGMGISKEMLPRIFDLFTREGRTPGAPVDGIGVGLAVVRNLVRLHHGIVEVQSAGPDQGSEFTVRLPLRQLSP